MNVFFWNNVTNNRFFMFDISMTYFESGQEQNPIFTFFIKLQIIYIQTLDVLSHTKISYDLRVCHDLIQGQFGKFNVTKRKSADFVSGLYLSYWERLDALTLHRDCLRPEGVLWFRSKVIWASSSSLEEKVQNLWSVYYIFLFMEYHRKFLFYTKIVYDLWVCHDYDPRSFGCNQV